jgi:hypothetical protein
LESITKVICIKNTLEIEDEILVNDMVQVGKIYDMQRILYTDDQELGNSWDLWNCYIYDGDNIWRLPLDFFEPLDEWRNKKINNILEN